jgi:DNA-binding response OmpR family regulator
MDRSNSGSPTESHRAQSPVRIQSSKAAPHPVMMGGRPARIMVADDDAEMRSLLTSVLRRDGYEVLEAPSGSALLEEFAVLLYRGEALPVDLIISDERMPGVLGLEILSGLREAHWPTPFILITGFGDEKIHSKAARLGAAAVFDKPFDVDALREAIPGILGRGCEKAEGIERP